MARKMLLDPDVRALVDEHLVPLFLRTGSVRALAEALTAASSDKEPIYANRLHGLLSDDPRRGLNEATFNSIRVAAKHLAETKPLSDVLVEETLLRKRAAELLARGYDAKQLEEELNIPPAVVRALMPGAVLRPLTLTPSQPEPPVARHVTIRQHPDWSYQDVAYRRCRDALAKGPKRKVGLVVPTGGGKTRIALLIALGTLADNPDPTARVIWVTHRRTLHQQARRVLQALVSELPPGVPANAAVLWERIDFVMLSRLEAALANPAPLALVVVDEAHHAAAPSYAVLNTTARPLRIMYLTATPNRTDSMPLGIDEIAFTTTYKELHERGAILMPHFEEFPVEDFEWQPDAINELAEQVIARAETDFVKTLVIAPMIEKVEVFHAALVRALQVTTGHILTPTDIGYVHSRGNSEDIETEEFIVAFRSKPRGILVSAHMLLEGFDDPSINTVVITYPSKSLPVLMQAAGRCVRYAPGKKAAYVLQARNSALAYHYEHRWLYQEISDSLRPRLVDRDYSSAVDLRTQVEMLLAQYNVQPALRTRLLSDLEKVVPDERCRLLLSGLPYDGEPKDFGTKSQWNAVLETEAASARFRQVFNDFCAADAEPAAPSTFLLRYLERNTSRTSDWSTYYTMLLAMHYAKQEFLGEKDTPGRARPYSLHGATTWLTYVTFNYRPTVPAELETFLSDCVNRNEVVAQYSPAPGAWGLAVKTSLPLGQNVGWLLDLTQAAWLRDQLVVLTKDLEGKQGCEQYTVIAKWREQLASCPIPQQLLMRIEVALGPSASAFALLLKATDEGTSGKGAKLEHVGTTASA